MSAGAIQEIRTITKHAPKLLQLRGLVALEENIRKNSELTEYLRKIQSALHTENGTSTQHEF
jgi:hypothetical protein